MNFLTLSILILTVITCSDGSDIPQVFACTPFTFVPSNAGNKTVQTSILRCPAYAAINDATGYTIQGNDCVLNGISQRKVSATEHMLCVHLPPDGDLEEVAGGKPTHASPPFTSDFSKEYAVDNTRASLYISALIAKPWWLVDLGDVRKIYKVLLHSRYTCCPERFCNVEVRGGKELRMDGEFSTWTLMTYYAGPYSAAYGYLTLLLDGIEARFVSVQIVQTAPGYLQINDVRVMVLRN